MINKKEFHQSMRGYFAGALYNLMEKNKDIVVVTGDLGYGLFDKIRDDFPKRFINVGAAEQTLVGIGVGLAMEGKIPVCYSITPFLLYRPFETIRNYVNREKISVILVGGGRGTDYLKDGFSHWAEEDKDVMKLFPNIEPYWPDDKEDIIDLLPKIIEYKKPTYLNLKR